MHLFDRLRSAAQRLAPVNTTARIVFEDPADIDAPAKVLVPSSCWMAAALAGGILPDVEEYLKTRQRIELDSGRSYGGCTWFDAQDLMADAKRSGHRISGSQWERYSVGFAPTIGPMTENEALEYLVLKDIPRRVWASGGNRPRYCVTDAARLPDSRLLRGAWAYASDGDSPISIDMEKARTQTKQRVANALAVKVGAAQRHDNIADLMGVPKHGAPKIDARDIAEKIDAAQVPQHLYDAVPESVQAYLGLTH